MALTDNVIAAHGLIMAIAFVILYPTGALIIRLLNVRGTLWIHAGWQVFAYLCVLAGLGMGAWIATTGEEVWRLFLASPIPKRQQYTNTNPTY